jgi:arabinose-5-phosphate isomerase
MTVTHETTIAPPEESTYNHLEPVIMHSFATIDLKEVKEEARQVFDLEIEALERVKNRIGNEFFNAMHIILSSSGKLVLMGVGKSGHIAEKLAATFCSTGTPAVYLNAAEASHGDLGIYSPKDVTILISKSGSTAEILRTLPTLKNFGSQIIAILGNTDSPLARQADVVIDASVEKEACALNLAPTSSTTTALVVGDALAVVLMKLRHFTREQFALCHPAGQLGRQLLLRTGDIMHGGDRLPKAYPQTSLKDVIIEISSKGLGAACVIDNNDHLLGIITDGDLRRAFQEYDDIRALTAEDVMTVNPTTIHYDMLLDDAARMMENRQSQITVLPVVDFDGRCLGLLRLHDILQTDLV